MMKMQNDNLNMTYQDMYNQAVVEIQEGRVQIDHRIDDSRDNRFGVTLLVRPSLEVRQRISGFLSRIKVIEPEQYYYPPSDMHITVLSIVSCFEGFDLDQINVEVIKQMVASCLRNIPSFDIHFQGITASPSCILVQGYPKQETLELIRHRLRTGFSQSKIRLSIDQRYRLTTAHATVIRFKNPLRDGEEFLKMMEHYKNFDFGYSHIQEMELVFNDWYQRKDRCQSLELYTLP
jgi:2'-5' RNA ligase